MRIHQQRVPIISPLDKDYYRSALNSSSGSNNYVDERRSPNPSSLFNDARSLATRSVENSEDGSDVSSNLGKTVSLLGFTIVGERDIC